MSQRVTVLGLTCPMSISLSVAVVLTLQERVFNCANVKGLSALSRDVSLTEIEYVLWYEFLLLPLSSMSYCMAAFTKGGGVILFF